MRCPAAAWAAVGLALGLAGAPGARAQNGGAAAEGQAGADGGEPRPDAQVGCVSLELAAARRVIPPDRFVLYGPEGGWLGDVVLAESCRPLEPRDRIYVHEKNVNYGRLCSREFWRHHTVFVQGTACEVVGVVDATSYTGEPPEPVSKILQERPPRGRLK